MKDECLRLTTGEEKEKLSDHCLNEDNWLVAFRTKKRKRFHKQTKSHAKNHIPGRIGSI